MEHRFLGSSGFRVPVLGFGAGTFGGRGPLFSAWGKTDLAGARRIVDLCLDAGVTLFDSADVYSDGASEEILGAALGDKRGRAIVSTKLGLRHGPGPNDVGTSPSSLVAGVDAALRRLRSDTIDLLQLHAYDAYADPAATMRTLDDLVRAGKVRYVGVSNFSGWQIMKHLAAADRHGTTRFVANQAYYSLVGRDYEWELMPLGRDQGVSAIVWSPLGWGRLTGKIRRGAELPEESRLHETSAFAPPVPDERLFRVVDALDLVAKDVGASIPEVAIAWLLARPTVASVLVGARDETQLAQNLRAAALVLSPAALATLDEASATTPPYPYYPYWNGQFSERSPVVARESVSRDRPADPRSDR